jgi:hypothetical protein
MKECQWNESIEKRKAGFWEWKLAVITKSNMYNIVT